MKAGFVRELLGRSDYAIIGEIVEPKTKVLDLAAAKANCWNGWPPTRAWMLAGWNSQAPRYRRPSHEA